MKYRSMILASAALHAGIANGMGLGNIDVQSYIGAPLEAQIQLFSSQEYGAADVRVNLARIEVYNRFEARREASHSDIQFDIVTTRSGEKAVLVRSSKRIVEPFLDIVVELSWPSGTTYRRYNLLLDPPSYAARWRVSAPMVSPALTQAAVKAEPVASSQQPVAEPSIELDGRYVVRSGDSLWKVARSFRAGMGLSIQQTMDLLYAENPQAFYAGDRNRLKLGATLSVPAAAMEQRVIISLQQIDNQSYSQPQVDIEFTDTAPSTVTINPVVTEEIAEPVSELEQLKAQLVALKNERAALLQFQEKVRAEMAQLQDEQKTMKQTIAVAKQITQQIELNKAEKLEASALAPPPSLQQTQVTPPAAIAEVEVDEVVGVSQAKRAVAQDLIGNGSSNPNMLIEKSGANFWYLLAMLPLGFLIVLMGLRARTVGEIKRTEEIRDEDLYELVFGTKRDRNKSDSPDQVRQAIHQIKEKVTHQESIALQAKQKEEDASKDDVNQMIELYLLYSQYQKALNVILTEIAKRPARKDLRLYLMQVYAQTNDWDAFDEQMEVLERIGDADLLSAAAQLRDQNAYEDLHRNAS